MEGFTCLDGEQLKASGCHCQICRVHSGGREELGGPCSGLTRGSESPRGTVAEGMERQGDWFEIYLRLILQALVNNGMDGWIKKEEG